MSHDIEPIAGGPDPWTDRLSEYLDGELNGSERKAIEAHLATCQSCTDLLVELRGVVARARTLENPPLAVDLWPGIEAQLAPRAARSPVDLERRVGADHWWGRRFEFTMPQLAAAAVLIVTFSGGLVWFGTRAPLRPVAAPLREASRGEIASRVAGAPEPSAAPESSVTPQPSAAPAVVAATAPGIAALDNPGYDAAVAELEQALAQGRGRLDPRTLRVVEQNLRVIDRALSEARRAVAEDPGNTWLRSHLAATMKRKVDLLRSVTLLASAQG